MSLRTSLLLACLVAVACASKDQLKPTNWLSTSELENVPSLNDVSFERLENMPLQKGAQLIEKLYHISQIKNDLTPNFVPSASNIPVWIVKSNGDRVEAKLSNYVQKATAQSNFAEDEVTIVLTGLPQNTETTKKAMRQLEQSYLQRYNVQSQQKNAQIARQQRNKDYDATSSEETGEEWKSAKSTAGNLIIIDLGATLTNFKRYAMLDVAGTGAMIGHTLVELCNKGVPREIIHLIGQGIAAHVAGAAGQEFTVHTGNKLRRITGLDPAKLLAKRRDSLVGLSRGDADFVDAIHTSSLAMGTPQRCGDVDFYPNGVSQTVPGAQNVIEAAVRATRYFAESVRPGGERNFPAVVANSLKQYKENNGFGMRAYMGINADFDLQGDYILEVNERSPFGKRAAAQKQINYHSSHQQN
ncbi:vitellogenin-3 [Drosophila nasuta]|uniref:Vitellogenin-3 n=1 Tax=Drosophila albomicans TaxID=7291 RepID=A0A6P8XZV0_DROAB|nr:vitellogenin-3 [Drosophila albomicans]XP_060663278.1 vitellogenin-3 [Drosophila nasuta]